jgi:hypothetical protein
MNHTPNYRISQDSIDAVAFTVDLLAHDIAAILELSDDAGTTVASTTSTLAAHSAAAEALARVSAIHYSLARYRRPDGLRRWPPPCRSSPSGTPATSISTSSQEDRRAT